MNIKSCNECGVVLDLNKLRFPKEIEKGDGSIDCDKAVWDGNSYVPFVKCPVCAGEITQED